MCGITCIASSKAANESLIQGMTDILYHRGPDSSSTWIPENGMCAFGHRRLAIIDLSEKSAQPMESVGKEKATIILNGEIYNYIELRSELEQLGYQFRSSGDTEVLLNAYIEWGEKVVDKLNGMWAFIIYDHKKNSLFLSRDRVGMKPLYIFQSGGDFVAASEIKSILKSGLVEAKVDRAGLVEYFSFQNIISGRTLFDGIEALPAGYNAVFDLKSRSYKEYKYWDYEFNEDSSATAEQFSEEFLEIFKGSLNRHLLSDVDIGVTLSGGMDSSSIVSLASRKIDKLNSFTGFFDTRFLSTDDRCHSEHEDARMVAREFGTNHTEKLIAAGDVVTTLPNIAWHLEDPKVAMCYTFYLMSQIVSQKVTVNLSGTGGDELFGGYPWRYGLIDKIDKQNEFENIYYDYWCRLLKDDSRSGFFQQSILKDVDINLPREAFNKVISPIAGDSILNQAFYFELKTFLDGMLMVEDKLGMAFSIETRFPFLDKEIVDLSLRIPGALKYKDGDAKMLLKKAMAPILPEETLYKRKQGFTPPDRTWYNRELKFYIENLLFGKRTMIHEYIDPKAIRQTIDRHKEGVEDNRLMIWSMMFFEGWLRTFIDNPQAIGREF